MTFPGPHNSGAANLRLHLRFLGLPSWFQGRRRRRLLDYQSFLSFYGLPLPQALRGDYSQGVLIIRVTDVDPIRGIGSRLVVLPPSLTDGVR